MRNRTFVIGDIHGAYKALAQLIEQLELRQGDQLIFLGDYVDGWPHSAQVIECLITLENKYSCIFIKGNHDVWCEAWLRDGMAANIWLRQGGQQTTESYYGADEATRLRHLQFFNRLQNYYVDGGNRLFIHAGFSSMHGPEKEPYESNYSWDRTLWEMAVSTDARIKKDSKLYPKRLLLYPEIYIGHTPTLNYDVTIPMQGANVWNVDTGAAFYGRLTAMDIETKEFLQSDIVQHLYPGEKGRHA